MSDRRSPRSTASKWKPRIDPEYTRNLKTPKNGWAHADEAHSLAALCEALGHQQCMNGWSIWDWCKSQKITFHALLKLVPIAKKFPLDFCSSVLDNLPFEVTP